jgi:hypothetical protein
MPINIYKTEPMGVFALILRAVAFYYCNRTATGVINFSICSAAFSWDLDMEWP